MGTSYSKQLEKTYLDLAITSKQMSRESKKREKESEKQKRLIEQYMKKNEMEVAKIHAENAIRSKSESVNYLRLSARLDAVAQRVKSALSQHKLSDNMKQVVSSLDGVLKSMDAEKIAKTMDKFEAQFDTLDVRTQYMDSTISSTTATATPQEDVTSLMNQIGDHIGIQVSEDLDANGIPVTIDKSKESSEEKVMVAEGDTQSNDKQDTFPKVDGSGEGGNLTFDELQARLDRLQKR